MRRKIVAGNWKMNKTTFDACDFMETIYDEIDVDVDVVICPSFVALTELSALFEEFEGDVMLGAQNFHYEESGAYTGEISASMLAELGVTHVIIGHSERRQYFAETDDTVNKKVKTALKHEITPIICVGESLEQRENNETFDFVKGQVVKAFNGISAEEAKYSVIAYEPIWAIGTGRTATSEQAEEVCKFIRGVIEELYDKTVSEDIRVQYGGSIKKDNAHEIFHMPNIDGGLVGGASLDEGFIDIVKAAF